MLLGDPCQLGSTIVDDGVNFALFSSVAERVELCLFRENGSLIHQLDLPHCDDNVWHGFVPGLCAGQRYGYRVHSQKGLRLRNGCNPSKLLIDPYARQLDSELVWHSSLFGSNHDDSALFVPKSMVTESVAAAPHRTRVPWSETLFYEVNVRGYTMLHPAVDDIARGTFDGLRNRDVVAYIKALGITSVELLPVHAFADEHHLHDKGLRNFWGYNTINFFSPAPRYSITDPIAEFRDMVNTLHDAGLEVILDVVYNHTAESGRSGPTLSFRGIDNRAYYRLSAHGHYINDTGCGNTIDADSPVVQQMIIDSLRYWASDMGVDGFRFDLATILGRHADGFSRDHPLLHAIANDPLLGDRKLIAEPWDPGPGGYHLGGFPEPWSELNDKFRDTTRAFWRGDDDQSAEFANRLRASSDIFEASGRLPHACVNKITSHDGFTLADVVSYESRHNEANGEANRDGHAHNLSCNHGVEGPTDDAAILAARRQHRLNLMATLLLAQGTPFILAGDEFGNSQGGNNNAYAQDNDIGWLDWQGIEADPGFLTAVKSLIELRRTTDLLAIDQFLHGQASTDDRHLSIRWINPNGSDRDGGDWGYGHAFGMVLNSVSNDALEQSIAVFFNAWHEDLDFELPAGNAPHDWQLAFSSVAGNLASPGDVQTVHGKSIAVLSRQSRS